MQKLEAVKAYDRAAKEREETVRELEQLAADHLATVENRQSVEDHLLELERQYGNLEGQRQSLRGEFSEATFNNDFEEIERIHNERERLDNELADTFASIEETRDYLAAHPLPVAEIAKVMAREYMISKPEIHDVLEALKAVHSEQASDLHSRRIKLSGSLRAHVSDGDIEQARRRVSSTYKEEAERSERQRAEYQDKQARYDALPIRQQSKPGSFQRA